VSALGPTSRRRSGGAFCAAGPGPGAKSLAGSYRSKGRAAASRRRRLDRAPAASDPAPAPPAGGGEGLGSHSAIGRASWSGWRLGGGIRSLKSSAAGSRPPLALSVSLGSSCAGGSVVGAGLVSGSYLLKRPAPGSRPPLARSAAAGSRRAGEGGGPGSYLAFGNGSGGSAVLLLLGGVGGGRGESLMMSDAQSSDGCLSWRGSSCAGGSSASGFQFSCPYPLKPLARQSRPPGAQCVSRRLPHIAAHLGKGLGSTYKGGGPRSARPSHRSSNQLNSNRPVREAGRYKEEM